MEVYILAREDEILSVHHTLEDAQNGAIGLHWIADGYSDLWDRPPTKWYGVVRMKDNVHATTGFRIEKHTIE